MGMYVNEIAMRCEFCGGGKQSMEEIVSRHFLC